MTDIIIIVYLDNLHSDEEIKEARQIDDILRDFAADMKHSEHINLIVYREVHSREAFFDCLKPIHGSNSDELILHVIARGLQQFGGFTTGASKSSFVSYSDLLLHLREIKAQQKLFLNLGDICGSAHYFDHLQSHWKVNLQDYFDNAVASGDQTHVNVLKISLDQYRLLSDKNHTMKQVIESIIEAYIANSEGGINTTDQKEEALHPPATHLEKFPSQVSIKSPEEQIIDLFQQLDPSKKLSLLNHLSKDTGVAEASREEFRKKYAMKKETLEKLQELWKDESSAEELIKMLRK